MLLIFVLPLLHVSLQNLYTSCSLYTVYYPKNLDKFLGKRDGNLICLSLCVIRHIFVPSIVKFEYIPTVVVSSVRSGETIEISYDDVSQIPFGSQITCGAGPHDTTADPDPSQPTALIQIAPREQVNISHEVQQTSVISDVRSDEQGELRGVGNYNSAGFFFCKSWGYPFPEVKWQKGKKKILSKAQKLEILNLFNKEKRFQKK